MGFEGGERPSLSKHSKPKWQRAKALGAETKGFVDFGLNEGTVLC